MALGAIAAGPMLLTVALLALASVAARRRSRFLIAARRAFGPDGREPEPRAGRW